MKNRNTKQVGTTILNEHAFQLELFCEKQDRSIAWYIKRALLKAMKSDGIIPKKHPR